MSANFEKIPRQEQERILTIILEEFAQNGYQRASTNAIVNQAGIPKGTLFYYFGSKKAMFLYALDEAVKHYTIIYRDLAGEKPPEDLFENLLHRMKVKLLFVRQEPLLYRFFYKVLLEIPEELQEEMAVRFTAYTTASQSLVKERINTSRLKEGVDLDSVLKMIQLMLDGLLNRYSPQFRQLTPEGGLELVKEIEKECRAYFEFIKEGVYQ